MATARIIIGLFLAWIMVISNGTLAVAQHEQVREMNATLRYKKISSFKERRDQNLVRQEHEYSCGASALATLINRLDETRNVTEKKVMRTILADASGEEVREATLNGFSVLELKKAAESMGYTAVALNLKDKNEIQKVRGPLIVLLNDEEVFHFTVLSGLQNDKVFLADPKSGNIRQGLNAFLERFTGVLLALE